MRTKPRSAVATIGGLSIPLRVSDASSNHEPLLWPTVSGYGIYDDLMYHVMTTDQLRNAKYLDAIRRLAPGRTVVDIGTGRDVNWARACIEAGATKSYAIEAMPETVEKARNTISRLGLGPRITLLPGLSSEVSLPERVDICVSEIIESIGGGEGAASILNDARARFLKPGGIMIPARCTTYIAAGQLPSGLSEEPAFSRTAHHYVQEIFRKVGRAFDLLLSVSLLSEGNIMSTSEIFEDLVFDDTTKSEYQGSAQLRIIRSGRMDGLFLWIRLFCEKGQEPIDSLKESVNWLPVFCPVAYPGRDVGVGDVVKLVWVVTTSDNHVNPNFQIDGSISRVDGTSHSFKFVAEHHGTLFRQNSFYQRLFS